MHDIIQQLQPTGPTDPVLWGFALGLAASLYLYRAMRTQRWSLRPPPADAAATTWRNPRLFHGTALHNRIYRITRNGKSIGWLVVETELEVELCDATAAADFAARVNQQRPLNPAERSEHRRKP
jgi:hypothetical protein